MAKVGRPTKYDEKYIKKVNDYLELNQDEDKQLLQLSSEKGYEKYENKLEVKLPTLGGFASFIETPERCIYDWRNAGDNYLKLSQEEKDKLPNETKELRESQAEFSQSLQIIVKEQEKRLINKGLSGDYNPTIAKLILSSNHGMREKSDVTSDNKPIESNTIIFKEFKKDATDSE